VGLLLLAIWKMLHRGCLVQNCPAPVSNFYCSTLGHS
jgi:hypothetical protein